MKKNHYDEALNLEADILFCLEALAEIYKLLKWANTNGNEELTKLFDDIIDQLKSKAAFIKPFAEHKQKKAINEIMDTYGITEDMLGSYYD